MYCTLLIILHSGQGQGGTRACPGNAETGIHPEWDTSRPQTTKHKHIHTLIEHDDETHTEHAKLHLKKQLKQANQ